MKRLLLILILTFSFQSWTKADDIRDFQIEGMSIGDSLLDFFSEDFIKKNIFEDYPASDKYKRFYAYKQNFFKQYEGVQVNFMKNDKKYIIAVLAGQIDFPDNINECFKIKNRVENDFDKVFKNAEKETGKQKKEYDKTGKSISHYTTYSLKSGEQVAITCDDYSKKISEKSNILDSLSVSLRSKKFIYFLRNEAF
jgi:hypothetical protein